MTTSKANLKKMMRSAADSKHGYDSMVRAYGYGEVNRSLMEVPVLDQIPGAKRGNGSRTPSDGRKPARRVPRVTAPRYVEKMALRPEVEAAVVELANRFQDKTFLPTFGDIAHFCRVYGIDEPASRSRASAIPRVFKFLATMEAKDIQKIVDWRMFSGPARVGPIADAIRRNGRAARARAAEGSRAGGNEES